MIDADFVTVEIFARQHDNSWVLKEYKQVSDSFTISTINLALLLKGIYDDVTLKG